MWGMELTPMAFNQLHVMPQFSYLPSIVTNCKLSDPVEPLFLVGHLLHLWQHFGDTLVCWYSLGFITFWYCALFINALPFTIFCTGNVLMYFFDGPLSIHCSGFSLLCLF